MRSWLLLLGAVMCSVSGAAKTQSSRDRTLAAIEAGETMNERPDVLAVATSAMVTGADCAEQPCWVAVHASTPLGIKDESTETETFLASKSSNNILKRCSGAVANRGSPEQRHLIAEPILFWLWALAPDAYFFSYVKDGKLLALPTPARPDSPPKLATRVTRHADTPCRHALPTRRVAFTGVR
jgi:hypothetical protein